jgi:hypothetical protein
MTRAMVKTGDQISFDTHPVMDHHSIGGAFATPVGAFSSSVAMLRKRSTSKVQRPTFRFAERGRIETLDVER